VSTRTLVLALVALHVAALVTAADWYASGNPAAEAVFDYFAVLTLLYVGYRAGVASRDD